jgi:20S proteasome subunit alpha 1
MSGSRSEGYDRLLTIFSPDGHLYQLEYAFKSVSAVGITSVGVKGGNCCVVATQRKVKDKMVDPQSVTNLFRLTPKIGCVMTGPLADCRAIAVRARQEATEFQYKYGYAIPCSYLAKRMADLAQQSTQYAGRRSLAVVAILCSVDPDEGPQLFRVDLAGSFFGYSACAAGTKEQEASSLFEKKIKERGSNMPYDVAVQTAIEVLQTCVGADFKPNEIEVGVTATDANGAAADFRVLADEEIEKFLGSIAERD